MIDTPAAAAYVLYRFLNDADELLYVGRTIEPIARFRDHRSLKDWWHEVTVIRMERLPDHAALVAAEKRAIRDERPRHNVVRYQGRSRQHCRPGRPEIGGVIQVRLGDLRPKVEAFAREHGVSQAEAIRQLLASALEAAEVAR